MGISHADIDALLAAAIRGAAPPCPAGPTEDWLPELVARARLHGVHAFLCELKLPWPENALQAIREQAIAQAVWELRHEQAIRGALHALAEAGTQPILIKGTALAYSLYPNPVLRTRGDTDVLVSEARAEQAHRALLADGWTRIESGDEASYQSSYWKQWPDGTHMIDLHWKINNSHVLAPLITHADLLRRSQALPLLGPDAFTADPAYALLIACLHRATHRTQPYRVDGEEHHEPDRLIWLLDIHLLARRFASADWSDWLGLVLAKGLARCCLDALEASARTLGTTPPQHVLTALRTAPPGSASEYLLSNSLRQHWLDLNAAEGTSGRLRWLGHRLFPPAAYMRHKYATARLRWLPWLYVRRAASGLMKRASLR